MAYRAVAAGSGFAVLHPHPGGVIYLPLGFALDAVGLHHTPPLGSCLTLGGPILLHGHLRRYTSQILSIMGQVMRAAVTNRFAGEKMISPAEFVGDGFLFPSQGFHGVLRYLSLLQQEDALHINQEVRLGC
jgi:hypothetical protein